MSGYQRKKIICDCKVNGEHLYPVLCLCSFILLMLLGFFLAFTYPGIKWNKRWVSTNCIHTSNNIITSGCCYIIQTKYNYKIDNGTAYGIVEKQCNLGDTTCINT